MEENYDDLPLKERLHAETSKIAWSELQRFYAKGVVVMVDPGLDLVSVGCSFAEDDSEAIADWMEQKLVWRADDVTAGRWFESDQTVWALVVAPWVLTQEAPEDAPEKAPH